MYSSASDIHKHYPTFMHKGEQNSEDINILITNKHNFNYHATKVNCNNIDSGMIRTVITPKMMIIIIAITDER